MQRQPRQRIMVAHFPFAWWHMTATPSLDEFKVDLETRNVSHGDGWVFRIVPSMTECDTWEVVCVPHPSPVTSSMADRAAGLALAAQQAYTRAVALRH